MDSYRPSNLISSIFVAEKGRASQPSNVQTREIRSDFLGQIGALDEAKVGVNFEFGGWREYIE